MPVSKEPKIYSGFVISMIGQQRGQRIPMNFKTAQSCTSAGTHRWEDDESPIDKGIKQEIEADAARKEQERLADEEHYRKLKEEGDAAAAQKINIVNEGDQLFLARPFPKIAVIPFNLIQLDEDGLVEITLANAAAKYEQSEMLEDGAVIGNLKELVDQFQGEIPEDWRNSHFLANISLAKQIRGLDKGDSLKRPAAEAIIEEWTKTDDQGSLRIETGSGEGEGGTDVKEGEGNRIEGATEDAAQRSKEKEKEFLDDE